MLCHWIRGTGPFQVGGYRGKPARAFEQGVAKTLLGGERYDPYGWSGKLGEYAAQTLLQETTDVTHVEPQYHIRGKLYIPDLETKDGVYEIKSGAWSAPAGAAGITRCLGMAYRYAPLVQAAGKPLYIVPMARLEHDMRDTVFSKDLDELQQEQLEFWRTQGITFLPGSSLLSPRPAVNSQFRCIQYAETKHPCVSSGTRSDTSTAPENGTHVPCTAPDHHSGCWVVVVSSPDATK
jgi:hypothetical protein